MTSYLPRSVSWLAALLWLSLSSPSALAKKAPSCSTAKVKADCRKLTACQWQGHACAKQGKSLATAATKLKEKVKAKDKVKSSSGSKSAAPAKDVLPQEPVNGGVDVDANDEEF